MVHFLSLVITVGVMAAVVLIFRAILRRPSGVSHEDPPGLRTVATFAGDDPEFFRDDRQEELLVGNRLFAALCDGLADAGIEVAQRAPVQNAQGAQCVVQGQRLALVLEWVEGLWVASVDWVPLVGAERRHVALTHEVFAPHDGAGLRQLLSTLDAWLKSHPQLKDIRWYRKERWVAEDTSDPAEGPFRPAAGDR